MVSVPHRARVHSRALHGLAAAVRGRTAVLASAVVPSSLAIVAFLGREEAGAAVGVLAICGGPIPLAEIPQGGRDLVPYFRRVLEFHPPAGPVVPVQEPSRSAFDFFHELPGDQALRRLICAPVPVLFRLEHALEPNVPRMVLTGLAPVKEDVVDARALDDGTTTAPLLVKRPIGLLFYPLAGLEPLKVVLVFYRSVDRYGQHARMDSEPHDLEIEFRVASCPIKREPRCSTPDAQKRNPV